MDANGGTKMSTAIMITQEQIDEEILYFRQRGIQATEFLARLSLAYRSKHFDYSRIHASEIGFCPRKILAHHQDLFPHTAPDWPLIDEFNPAMLKGLIFHSFIPYWYPGIEYEVEIQFTFEKLPFVFHVDGYDASKNRIIEVKTSGGFGSITNACEIFDGYAMQIHCYMLGLKKEEAELWVYHANATKAFEELTEEITIQKSPLCIAEMKGKMRRCKKLEWYNHELPPLWECRNCGYFNQYCERRLDANE